MKSDELLKDFLSGHPDAPHPLDDARFARYAIACAEEGRYINTDAIGEHVSKERMEDLPSHLNGFAQG